jgi:hypothetical protein
MSCGSKTSCLTLGAPVRLKADAKGRGQPVIRDALTSSMASWRAALQ